MLTLLKLHVSLLESLFQLMGPLISLFELTGEMQQRLGAGLPYTVPRGTYRCSDGKWVAVRAYRSLLLFRAERLLAYGPGLALVTQGGLGASFAMRGAGHVTPAPGERG